MTTPGASGSPRGRVRRQVSYRWRLREVMAVHGLYTTKSLVPLLRERGIDLSVSQVHRLVTGTPERLSLSVLAALCDIFQVAPGDLITTTAETAAPRRLAISDAPAAPGDRPSPGGPVPALPRPTRVHLLPEATGTTSDTTDATDATDATDGPEATSDPG
jgi:DNA-binding Xre family transcriptional regulator